MRAADEDRDLHFTAQVAHPAAGATRLDNDEVWRVAIEQSPEVASFGQQCLKLLFLGYVVVNAAH